METLLDVVSLKMVKNEELRNKYDKINTPKATYELIKDLIIDSDKEMLIAISLDNQSKPTNVSIISVGTSTSAIANPREVYKFALLSNASRIILVHNHPSGSLEPSKDDIETTKAMIKAGKILNIIVNDHIIVSENGYYSMKKENRYIFDDKLIFAGTTR